MSEPETSDPHPPKRVVLVDDDAAMLDIIHTFLIRAGHHVTRFSQFKDAKKYLGEEPVDVIISDIRLGPFNGLQLAIMAKVQHPAIVAIVMTGFDDPVVRDDAGKEGVEFLLKPFNAEQLLAKIG